MIIDTHAHLDFEHFAGEEEAVLKNAADAGVDRIITVGTTLERSRKSVAIAEQYANVWATVGLHPDDAHHLDDTTVAELTDLASRDRVVAVGEIGLDLFHEDNPPLDVQVAAFRRQAMIAHAANLPIVIHSRAAHQPTLDELTRLTADWSRDNYGVVHCFEGDIAFADAVLDLGLLISFTATISYPKNDALREVVKHVPLDRMMVETDCPFLPPQDKRGQRNEPAYVRQTAELVAELKGVSLDEIAAQTTRTAEAFFRLP